jgi:hypothetical protein
MKGFLPFLQGAVGPIVYTWGAIRILQWYRARRDVHVVCEWLKANSHGEPAESPKSLLAISEGTRLPAERVRIVCLKSPQIYQSFLHPGHYSIRRTEPQSMYEKRGVIRVTR